MHLLTECERWEKHMDLDTAQSQREAVVQAWMDAFDGNWDTFDEVFHEDLRYEDPNVVIEGREELKAYMQEWLEGFPDAESEFTHTVAENNMVMSVFHVQGTHEEEFQGIPATGNEFEGIGMSIDRIEDGKVIEEINTWDNLTFLEQLEIDPGELRSGD